MRGTIVTLVASTMFAAGAAASPRLPGPVAPSERGDPAVPRALTELNRLGTPAAIMARAGIATAAVVGIELHADSIVTIDIHTRGEPRVHVWEPLYLKDRVRLRAEIAALPEAGIVVPKARNGNMRFSMTRDSAANTTAIVIDMPRIAWGRVDNGPDLTTIRLAAERPAVATSPVPQVADAPAPEPVETDTTNAVTAAITPGETHAAHAVPRDRTAMADALTALAGALSAVAGVLTALFGAAQEWLMPLRPHAETIALGLAALLATILLGIRLRRHRRRRAARPQPKANPWVVRTLAAKGGSVRDIAGQTGLPREAVVLLMRIGAAQQRPAERAAYGRNFPAGMHAGFAALRLAS